MNVMPYRFGGIFGLYYSLQYLSLSDATVLQFLSPMFTAIAGAVFLHEAFSWREAFAGCTSTSPLRSILRSLNAIIVASLVGVILIARPRFLFGVTQDEIPIPPDDLVRRVLATDVEPVQRMVAVGCVPFPELVDTCLIDSGCLVLRCAVR